MNEVTDEITNINHTVETFYINEYVVYIPEHLLHGDKTLMIKDENLGIVVSKNSKFIFVKYCGSSQSQATNPKDLFSIEYYPNLKNRLDNLIFTNNENYK